MTEQAMIEIVRRVAPWAQGMTDQEVEFVVRRSLSMGLDPLNPAEVQIWKDERGRVNFQIGYTMLETWVKKTYGQHTQPRYERLTADELRAEGMAETTVAFRCTFIMCTDLKAMAEMAAIVGNEEALRMFTCVGIGSATAQEFGGQYFAPKGRSPAWKVQKRALTDAYRQKFGVPNAAELAEARTRLGYTLPSPEDYEGSAALTEDTQAVAALAQASADRRENPPAAITAQAASELLYDTPAQAVPAPAPAASEGEIVTDTPAPSPAPAPTPAPAIAWPFPVLQAVLKAGLSDSTYSAKAALAHSNLTAAVTPEEAVAWMRIYRAARDSGQGVAQAAESANAQERKEVAG